jgi:DNA-binding NarL/FixJ family response regulator
VAEFFPMSETTVIIGDRTNFYAACSDVLSKERGVRVLACTENMIETVKAVDTRKPRILLIDLNLIREYGHHVLSIFRWRNPRTRIILLCERASTTEIVDALCYGAMGYLDKKDIHTLLAKSIRAVDRGEAWVPRRITTAIAERLVRQSLH